MNKSIFLNIKNNYYIVLYNDGRQAISNMQFLEYDR